MSYASGSKKAMSTTMNKRPMKVIAIPRKVQTRSIGTQTEEKDKKGFSGQIHALMSDFYKKQNDSLDLENDRLRLEVAELEASRVGLYQLVEESNEDVRLLRRQLENANEWSEQNWARTQTLLDAIEGFMSSVDDYTKSMLYDEIGLACRRHGTDFHGLLEDPDETESENEDVHRILDL